MSKHILIIGGMGPQASLHAHKRIISLSQQTSTSDNSSYPKITHLSVNVNDFISDEKHKPAAAKQLISSLSDINMESIDIGFIACNTAHILFDDLQKVARGKLVSIIDTVTSEIDDASSIGIVATPSTIRKHLYGDKVKIIPDQTSLANTETIIRKVIAGTPVESLTGDLQFEIDKLLQNGAERVILGCSELSMFSQYLDQDIIIDPIDSTIHKIIG